MVIKMQVSWSTTFSVASCPLSCGCSLARSLARSLYSYLQAVGKHSNAPRNYPSRPKHHPFHLHGVGCLNTPSPSPCNLTCLAKEKKKRSLGSCWAINPSLVAAHGVLRFGKHSSACHARSCETCWGVLSSSSVVFLRAGLIRFVALFGYTHPPYTYTSLRSSLSWGAESPLFSFCVNIHLLSVAETNFAHHHRFFLSQISTSRVQRNV
ncbi:hypothetical protein HDK77DRAFT_75578 [Phyllosticta capitalensis]